jgi:hypothetical protein
MRNFLDLVTDFPDKEIATELRMEKYRVQICVRYKNQNSILCRILIFNINQNSIVCNILIFNIHQYLQSHTTQHFAISKALHQQG